MAANEDRPYLSGPALRVTQASCWKFVWWNVLSLFCVWIRERVCSLRSRTSQIYPHQLRRPVPGSGMLIRAPPRNAPPPWRMRDDLISQY